MGMNKNRTRKEMWEILRRGGPMTAMQVCDEMKRNGCSVSTTPTRASGIMRCSHMFEKHDKVNTICFSGQTAVGTLVWRARSIEELVQIFRDPTRRQGLHKIPSVIRSSIEGRL